MNDLESLLRQTAGLFEDRRQPWALVGGLAVSVRTEPRFTRDLDSDAWREFRTVQPQG